MIEGFILYRLAEVHHFVQECAVHVAVLLARVNLDPPSVGPESTDSVVFS